MTSLVLALPSQHLAGHRLERDLLGSADVDDAVARRSFGHPGDVVGQVLGCDKGTNRLGHFASSRLLGARIRDRVISVVSSACVLSRLHLDDVNWRNRTYSKWAAYGESKLAVMLFNELVRRGVRSYMSGPGATDTDITRDTTGVLPWIREHTVRRFPAHSADTGARASIQAVTTDLPTGSYLAPRFSQRGKPTLTTPRTKARDSSPAVGRLRRNDRLRLARLTGADSRVDSRVTQVRTTIEPRLPAACGPLSLAVRRSLTEPAPRDQLNRIGASVRDSAPYGLDLQLALYMCYELHYRGFAGVDPTWEWDPGLLYLRAQLERTFLSGIRRDVGPIEAGETAEAEMDSLSIESSDGTGPSYWLRDSGTWDQMREYFVHRSLYHLKEGDPHAWAIPRLVGQAKASFVAVEFDEYGAGHGPNVHQQLFADLLSAAGLDSTYLAYLEAVPAESLAVVNLMSLFGLHRQFRGSAMGHFASTEITSSPGSRRLVEALQRLGAPPQCVAFYREHVEADAVHEQVVRIDVVSDMVAREPHLDPDVVFGIRAHAALEDRLADVIMTSWNAGTTSLRRALD